MCRPSINSVVQKRLLSMGNTVYKLFLFLLYLLCVWGGGRGGGECNQFRISYSMLNYSFIAELIYFTILYKYLLNYQQNVALWNCMATNFAY